MAAPHSPAPRKHPRTVRLALLAGAAIALLAFVAVPTGADHVQTETVDGSTFTLQFDHGGDNAYWVEVEVRPLNGDFVAGVQVQVEGEAGMHAMQAQSNTWERQQAGWTKYATSYPYDQVYVPPGKRVKFVASAHDDGGGSAQIASCWFTHPAGSEQCDLAPPSTTFDPPFTGFRGNEWWVQANVGTNQHCIAKVDVRSNNGAWMPLAKKSWGPTAWAASYHFPQGSILQMRATACDGRTDLSSCRQWIPPANTDATIVACPSGGGGTAFDATFSGVKGNDWWVQVSVSGNQPVQEVAFRTNCSEEWRSLTKQSYGWARSVYVPPGSKVDFRAISTTGNMDFSGGYIWPNATPTSAC